ncbi:MAG: hypothetical protein AB9873_13145 [Syntrophobacteraceae bacterium]
METLLAGTGYRFQKSFISSDGVGVSGSEGVVTLSSLVQLNQKRAILAKSGQVYIVLDESKIGGGGEAMLHYPADWSPSMKLVLATQDHDRVAIKELRGVFRDTMIVV